MSVKSKTKAKTTKKIKTTTPKQQFIRLNLDEKLDEILNFYQQKYTLLSKPEIVRMLLNEGDWKLKSSSQNLNKNNNPSFKKMFEEFKRTNPVQVDLTEDQMFLEYEKFNQSN